MEHPAKLYFPLCWIASFLILPGACSAQEQGPQAYRFEPLFNGKDLTGWVNVNCAPGTFYVQDDQIITTGKPTGFLRTARPYENFIAELEWMHINRTEPGNSGCFVWADPLPALGTPYARGIEVQVLVNTEKEGYYTSHGDLFSIHGATCKPDRPHPHGWARCLPSEHRCKGGGEWNHYRIVARDGTLKLHVNGKEVSGVSECRPRKGYLALESEGAECHFRNLRVRELPSTHPGPEETAERAVGFRSLFTGIDLSGWQLPSSTAREHWQVRDGILSAVDRGKPAECILSTENVYEELELRADVRFTGKEMPVAPLSVLLRLNRGWNIELGLEPGKTIRVRWPGQEHEEVIKIKDGPPPGAWSRLSVSLKGLTLQVEINGKKIGSVQLSDIRTVGKVGFQATAGTELRNLFLRPLER